MTVCSSQSFDVRMIVRPDDALLQRVVPASRLRLRRARFRGLAAACRYRGPEPPCGVEAFSQHPFPCPSYEPSAAMSVLLLLLRQTSRRPFRAEGFARAAGRSSASTTRATIVGRVSRVAGRSCRLGRWTTGWTLRPCSPLWRSRERGNHRASYRMERARPQRSLACAPSLNSEGSLPVLPKTFPGSGPE